MFRVSDVSLVIAHDRACVNVNVAQDDNEIEIVWITVMVSDSVACRVALRGTGDVFLNQAQLQLKDI